jgi:hypothetical protein
LCTDIGPIPGGKYWVDPAELAMNHFYRRHFSRDSRGDYRLTIHPFTTTDILNREGGFFIYGGKTPGSKGCIDLTSQINTFVGHLMAELGYLGNCQIHLLVQYTMPLAQLHPNAKGKA